jgi:predicted transcriptional regulator
MRSRAAILDVMFPRVRAEILRSLFGAPNRQRYVRELARETNLALRTVQDELRKLSAIGLLSSYSNGYHRFYRPNAGHALVREIRRIVEMSDRLPRVERSALRASAGSGRPKHRRRRKMRQMRPNRAGVSWGLFSRRKT